MAKTASRSLKEIAEHVRGRVTGDPNTQINRIASIKSARTGDLVFVEDAKNLAAALACAASAVIAGEFVAQQPASKPVLVCAQPKLAFARAARLLYSISGGECGIHANAVVHPSARISSTATVEERAVICEGVEIGEKTCVGAGSVVGANAKLGRDCQIYPNVTIYPGVRIGNRVIVHAGAVLGSDGFGYVRDNETGRYEKFPQIGGLEIQDDVEIGANSTIDRGALDVTRIGRGTKLDNLVHIGHNCQLGENVVLAAQTGLSGSIVVENNVVAGGQVGIGESARIEEGVMLGGQAGVLPHKVVRGNGVAFWGTPARPLREYLKQLAALALFTKKG